MSKSIKISPKYGVNPSITKCFWCGGDKNELVLMGKLPGDKEAPMHCIMDYKPCDKCKEAWSKGITLIGVTQTATHKDQLPISRNQDGNVYPSGNLACITEEAVKRLFSDNKTAEIRETLLKKRVAYFEEPFVKELLEKAKEDAGEKPADSQ